MSEYVKCLIIGAGPAGYTAAIYAARADLKPVLYTGVLDGGQLTQTTEIENYPGYPDGITGLAMMENFRRQAARLGTDIRAGFINRVDFNSTPFWLEIDSERIILADTVIIATGASAKWLGINSETKYSGFGVSACAICDGFFYKGQVVAVVGAGDTAAEEACFLAKMCRKVYMIVRRNQFRASKAMVHRVSNTCNIEVLFNTETEEILGDGLNVTGLLLVNNQTKAKSTLSIDGVFIAIGHKPNTEVFEGCLDMNDAGYIKTMPGTTCTNVAGVFCCGDAQDHVYRQAVTAAGTGCMAAIDAERHLANSNFILKESISLK